MSDKQERRVGISELNVKVELLLKGQDEIKKNHDKHWEYCTVNRDRIAKVDKGVSSIRWGAVVLVGTVTFIWKLQAVLAFFK